MSEDLLFPQGFMWGAATSSHQVEGDNTRNDWWLWEKAGRTPDASGRACDSYRRYEEDFDAAKNMHHNAHRLSIEWSRVEPKQGVWDEEAVAHYQRVIAALKARGLEPMVTLHHFTNPAWTTDLGGWENPRMVDWFDAYAKRLVRALGADVRHWITFNEQNVFTFKGYLEKSWPPGKSSLRSAWKVIRHLALAHLTVYSSIHEAYAAFRWKEPQVGVAHFFLHAEAPAKGTGLDRWIAGQRAWINNDLFFAVMRHYAGRGVLRGIEKDRKGYSRFLDFIGVNYYFREIIRFALDGRDSKWLVGEVVRDPVKQALTERNELEWEIYPPGFGEILRRVYRRYGVPLWVTENGVCTRDEAQRERFLYQHLKELLAAIREGVPVKGYFYWSLIDNFEWAIGYFPRFGLLACEEATLNRKPKRAAAYYGGICRENALPKNTP